MIKDDILRILQQNTDASVSGAQIARELGISRTAVWKGVEQLRAEGYIIRSATNRGYLLSSRSDVLSAGGIRERLTVPGLTVEYCPSVLSTNTLLKERAAAGAAEGLVLAAGEQTGGRGRLGRSFLSPAGTGVYLSLLLRPALSPTEATKITACAAVAVAEAIEALSGEDAAIKWVNDIFLRGKKVCGILTEAAMDVESGGIEYVIVGIGVNVREPEGGFPEELRAVAGAVFPGADAPAVRCRLAAEMLNRFMERYSRLGSEENYVAYKKRSFLLGKPLWLLSPGREPESAVALDIDRDFALLVRTESGEERRVLSGEVSVRPIK